MTRSDPKPTVPSPNVTDPSPPYRSIPSVDAVAQHPALTHWQGKVPHTWMVDAARQAIEEVRCRIGAAPSSAQVPTVEEFCRRVDELLKTRNRPSVRPVINATGIILHTGLGRAPLSKEAAAAVGDAAEHYSSIEIDLETGRRGDRLVGVRELLCRISGAEGAVVVNNNAAATLLALAAVTEVEPQRREVVVCRGELIEIGGSFRLPEIMAQSGAILREVGTTNKTRAADYEKAIGPNTAALMKVHTSNYRVVGFTESVTIAAMVELGRRHGLPVIHDIGSGAMHDFGVEKLEGEPMAPDSIAAGADLVLFSGDKLLGGPQSGVILGSSRWTERIRRHPLMRALRVDKLTLAALEATLRLHDDPERARRQLPVWAMAAAPLDDLRRRADRIAAALGRVANIGDVDVVPTEACLGGGSLPEQNIASIAVRLKAGSVSEADLSQRLRRADPPVIARVGEGAVFLDLRSIFEDQDEMIVEAVSAVMGED